MNRKYLTAVTPLPDHVLQVDFVSGSRLLLDMKPYLDKIRFRPLADARVWNSAVTNGIFVRFGDVELSHDEILSMAEQVHWKRNPTTCRLCLGGTFLSVKRLDYRQR